MNVLIALLDRAHVHHSAAMDWLGNHIDEGWASCPLTQNGCVRIMSQPGYPKARAPRQIAERLREATHSLHHAFWPDEISILDGDRFDWNHLLNPRQLTDAYLLALAVHNEGTFVTFDHAIPLGAVSGAATEHLVGI